MREAFGISAFFTILILSMAWFITSHQYILVGALRTAPAALYPNGALTPGDVATNSIADLTRTSSCGTYSQCHRQTSEALKAQIRREYPTCPKQQEIDHLVPLALGGADDAKNLWCQPLNNQWKGQNWGYKTKDRLETYLVDQVKAGKMKPNEAQQCIMVDWVVCYRQNLSSTPSYEGVDSETDTDDEVVE